MALWKKTSSGQGDPPGPLGKYITMYNKAVKTLGTDNPEVLKNFFASQQYGQNNVKVQQNNNINKAPQPKESKVGNVAGDVGTLALSTLQNFGMNILGDVLKTVAPKAAILDVLPQTTTNQYVKQRNQSLGQNIKDVADATNTVAAFEVGAPLVGKAIQTGMKYVKPYVKPVVNTIKNRLHPSTEVGGHKELFAKDLTLDDVIDIKDRNGKIIYPSSNGEPLLKMRNPFKKEPIIIPEEYIPSDKIKQKSSVVLNDSKLPKKIEPFSINEQNYPNVKYNVYKEPNLTSIFPNNGIVEYPGIKKYAVDITNFYEKSPNVVNNRLNRIQWHVDELENEPISLIKKSDYKMNFWGTKNIEKEKYLFPHNAFEEKIRTINTQKQILRNVEENKPILDDQLKYANEKELKAIKDFDRERLHRGDYSLLFTPDFDSPPTLFGKSDAGRYYKGWNAPSELRNKAFLSRTNNPTETLEAGLHELGHMSNHNKNYFSSRDKLVIENVIDNSKTNNSELKDALKEFTYEEIMADTRPLRFAMGDLDGSLKYTPDMLDNFFTKSNKAVLPSRMKKLFDLGVLDTEQLSKVLNTYKSFVPGVVTTGTGLSFIKWKNK